MSAKTITPPAMRVLCASLLALWLGGCSFIRPFNSAERAVKDMPENLTRDSEESELFVETAPWPDSVFQVRGLQQSAQLPNTHIEKLSVTEAGLYDVIQLLFEKSGLAVTFEGGTDNIRRYGPVTVYNLSGSLTDVMNSLGASLGFFWSVNGTTVTIEAEQQFVVDMPPILNDDNLAGINNTLQYLGVRDSFLDRNERRLVFRSNRKVLRSVQAYMDRLRQSRSMIIYDAQILQVDLKDSQKLGIQWSNYTKRDVSKAAFSSVIPGAGNSGIDVTLVGQSFNGRILLDFLRTQGTVKNLSRPRIGVMSGTRGSLRVGNNTTIVSKVGRDLSSTVSQTTVETKDVRTGLELNLFGEEHDRTVYTRIALSITELLELTNFEALGTSLSLPRIADRELRTQIRSRPGDTIILGGITINRTQLNSSQGIGTGRNSENLVSELVVVLRPRLVMFRPGPLQVGQQTNALSQAPQTRDDSAQALQDNLKQANTEQPRIGQREVKQPPIQFVAAEADSTTALITEPARTANPDTQSAVALAPPAPAVASPVTLTQDMHIKPVQYRIPNLYFHTPHRSNRRQKEAVR